MSPSPGAMAVSYTHLDVYKRQAKALRERCRKELDMDGDLWPVGCVVGAHAGPGACVVTYLERA